MAVTCGALLVSLVLALGASAQHYNDYTTPVPILKQINRHNEDGSYSYGYEGADGSFKIETKHATGEVYGKYGYVDDTGSVREVEYGASRRGFEPAGQGINVPPPTLQNNYVSGNAYGNDYDDGQYHEDPSVYFKDEKYNSRPRPQQQYNPPAHNNYNSHNPPAHNNYNSYSPPAHNNYNSYSPPAHNNYNSYSPPAHNNYNSYSPPAHNNYNSYRPPPAHVDHNLFRGHPAKKFDVSSGSYSLEYTG
ncbi:probable serine/threonine-protein kinase clkA [Bacillus rossius redtenbacheri]|uniref:probable serine/threonine-protein kinase clkA n=1 Tax=Bacillus rossius redtenbacheri TaxID=93214 RepID=UPI002FDCC227